MEKGCSTCMYWLGGIYNFCRLNLEKECGDGEYQAWRIKADKTFIRDMNKADVSKEIKK